MPDPSQIETLSERAEVAASRLETAIGLSRSLGASALQAAPDQPVESKPLDDRAAMPVSKPKPKARPTPAKLFVGPAEEDDPLARAGGGSIVKALRGMR